MRIVVLRRYPVKSMLGEQIEESFLTASGLEHDRAFALIDSDTGLVATAKHPRIWRDLLRYSATVLSKGRTVISSPAGWAVDVEDAGADEKLSAALGRSVRVTSERPPAATVERPDPEDVLDEGVDAEVPAATLEIGQGTPGTTFVDYAPVHLITTATLDSVGVEYIRYRPNLVVETPPGTPAFIENSWVGRQLEISGSGRTAVLQVSIPTPRCAVPTLVHGELERAPQAVRALMSENRVDVPGFGVLPCAGAYAQVLESGTIRAGDLITLR